MTIPLRYFLIVAKGIFMKDSPASVVWHETWPMTVIAVFTLTAAAWLFRKRLE
jgi:ABC-2 type transport system permease protein